MKKRRVVFLIFINLFLMVIMNQFGCYNLYGKECTSQEIKQSLPKDNRWKISQTKSLEFNQIEYIVVGASYSDDIKGKMGGKVFVLKNNGQKMDLVWSSSLFEATSILSVDLYCVKSNNKALIVAKYAWGGARGTMNNADILIISNDNVIKFVKHLFIGIGYIEQTSQSSVEIEGERLDKAMILSLKNDTYWEETKTIINDILNWRHPVKRIFEKYQVTVDRVELLYKDTYPIFYVWLPKDLLTSEINSFLVLIQDVAKANAYWDYQIVDIKRDIVIKVQCSKSQKTIILAELFKNNVLVYKTQTKVQ